MNKTSKNIVLQTNLDNGPSMKCPASKVTLMKDHVSEHGTTTSMPGSPDHSKGRQVKRRKEEGKGRFT